MASPALDDSCVGGAGDAAVDDAAAAAARGDALLPLGESGCCCAPCLLLRAGDSRSNANRTASMYERFSVPYKIGVSPVIDPLVERFGVVNALLASAAAGAPIDGAEALRGAAAALADWRGETAWRGDTAAAAACDDALASGRSSESPMVRERCARPVNPAPITNGASEPASIVRERLTRVRTAVASRTRGLMRWRVCGELRASTTTVRERWRVRTGLECGSESDMSAKGNASEDASDRRSSFAAGTPAAPAAPVLAL